MLRKTLLIWWPLILSFAACQLVTAQDSRIGITGKVIDENSRPVKHALVIIQDRDTNASVEVKTDGTGAYQAWHLPAQRCTVRVVPPLKTGLAQSMLAEVEASEARHVFVSVHKGFEVKGRVVCAGKPLRNVQITVKADDGDNLHGGGITCTDAAGRFAIVLTPGQKTFDFHDIEAPGAPPSFSQQYIVTADSTMTDVAVPHEPALGQTR